MLLKTSLCGAVMACGVLALASLSTAAGAQKDGKDRPALSGTWARKGGQLKIEFSAKDVVKIHPHGDKVEFAVVCKYTIDKAGLLKAKITELEGKDEFKAKAKGQVPPGLEFSFKWKARADNATLEDLHGKDVEILKSHLEGEYEKK